MRFFNAALFTAVALLVTPLAGPAAAQPPGAEETGGLAGKVTDPATTPLGGIEVAVLLPEGGEQARAQTGREGAWSADGLPVGDYRVRFTDPARRHVAATLEQVTVAGGHTTSGVDAVLDLRTLPLAVVAGENRVATAVLASRHGFPDGAETVVVASAHDFPDALAAAPLAAHEEAPLLLVGRRLGPAVTAELRRLGARRATIVGAVAAVSATVQAELEREGITTNRIAGDGRFDTAALVALEVGPAATGEVIVVSGEVFADAMGAAPLAAAHGIPVLLTEADVLPADTAAALALLTPRSAVVVGGTAAVSEAVLAQLPHPVRVAGPDRHATSVAVAELMVQRGADLGEVAVATAVDYPDGLAAAPALARSGSPLLLAHPDLAHGAAVYEFLDRHLGRVGQVTVFGGDAALGEPVRSRLARPYEPYGVGA